MKRDLLIFLSITSICLLSFACSRKSKELTDFSLIKNEIKWGMDYNSIEKILSVKFSLKLLSQNQIDNKIYYTFSGGNFIGIKTKGWKIKSINNAIEGIDILIDNQTNEDLTANYYKLANYFHGIAEYKCGASNDSWKYYRFDEDGKKVIDSIIFMYISGNKILIDICNNYNNRENIFMSN
jgi:hypothetical protein